MKRINDYITIAKTTIATINMVDCSISLETTPSIQIHWGRIGKDLMRLGRAIVTVAREVMVMSDVSLSALSLSVVMA